MATNTGAQVNGNGATIHQPLARNPRLATPKASRENLLSPSAPPSSPGTPVPADAPPSVRATVSVRRLVRAESKQAAGRRLFPTIKYRSRVSHFDQKSDYHDFRGFFVLFWVGLLILVITASLRNFKETGRMLSIRQWDLFTKNIWDLLVSDHVMAASTFLSLPLHLFMKNTKGQFRWDRYGMALQSLFQAAWLLFWVSWPFVRDWTWTAQVFFTLHILVLFMKMHSYAFYNGHLANTLRRLSSLDNPKEGAMDKPVVKYPTPKSSVGEISQELVNESENATAASLAQLRDDLARELVSPEGLVVYPQNLTVANFADFLLVPTLCYELEYPRTPSRSYEEIFYKILAVFGCVFLLTITSEEFIIPVLAESALRLQTSSGWYDACLLYAETVSRMLFPFMVTFLLVFLVIFEYTLGAFAEITCFADRQFYFDWWNSADWLEFSREWNIPVHHFCRRHIYSASLNTMSRPFATVTTFLISALGHELVMFCISRKFRGYGFIAMMLQMPIVMIQRSKWVRHRTLANNVLFWCSMILGLSMICALYVLL